MSVGTGTVGSGTKIKYVSWGAGDTAKAIFDGIASVMTGSGGWTLASGASGSFFTTYYDTATTDVRRVYSSPLLAQGSGLTTKYVMLRVATGPNITVNGSSTSGFLKIQLIPFQSWNSGTDVGTNQAGTPIINNQATTYGFDLDFIINTGTMTASAPQTLINNTGAGLLYVAYGSTAAYLVMWPYYSVNSQLFNSQRVPVLVYGEVSEDVASYTNCPPVYVTTLQRMCSFSGLMASYGASIGRISYGSDYGAAAYGANNANIGSLHNNTNWTLGSYYTFQGLHPGPMWLSPCAPGSTTGYTGIADTLRTGPQASALQRMTLGHMGEYGFTGHTQFSDGGTASSGSLLMNGNYTYYKDIGGSGALPKYTTGITNYPYTIANTYQSAGGTALNSTNFKGIEPIFGGGALTQLTTGWFANFTAAYGANPFPLMWQWGRIRGLKYVGAPPTPGTSWSTLDTVSMMCDADGFYTKTGGSATTFALIGFAPFTTDTVAFPAGDSSANMFWAVPA